MSEVPFSQHWGFVTGLENGVSYTFTVAAVRTSERGVLSKPSNSVTPLPAEIHVKGNNLVNGAGQPIRLFGVNRSGTEYKCTVEETSGASIFSGPSDPASIAIMASWHINAVRVPLNEDCWLGINGANPAYSASTYQQVVSQYVAALNDAGLVAILDLHWNAPGSVLSRSQQDMADADHALTFWSSIASAFASNPAVVFDLYNEPRNVSWDCWRSGCATPGGWRVAGMQSLIDTVRAAGARQPVLISGLNSANDLSGWLSHPLHDPVHQLIAGIHVYDNGSCTTTSCWNQTIGPVARQVPVVTSELGEFDRRSDFIASYMAWADAQRSLSVSYLGWSWDAGLGEGGPSLIQSFDGTPTRFGLGLRTHLESLFERGVIRAG